MYACESWACYDLAQAEPVKKAVDAPTVELARTAGAKQFFPRQEPRLGDQARRNTLTWTR
jgi:hypothetical protein